MFILFTAIFQISSLCMILFIYFYCFWPYYLACGILVPQPGIEPMAMHWTARKFSCMLLLFIKINMSTS